METGDHKKPEQKYGEKDKEKSPPDSKKPPKDSDSDVGNTDNSPWEPGGPRKKRDGQESDEERQQKLKAFMAAQLAEAEKNWLSQLGKDKVPPRDYITGITADFLKDYLDLTIGVKRQVLDDYSDRDAFAGRMRAKAEQEFGDKKKTLENMVRGEAENAVEQQSGETQRRDVTGKFEQGRSMIGSKTAESTDGHRDVTGHGQAHPGSDEKLSQESQRRDVTGNAAEGQAVMSSDTGGSIDSHRDVTGLGVAIVIRDQLLRRDVTARIR